jgi:hypothetical protein
MHSPSPLRQIEVLWEPNTLSRGAARSIANRGRGQAPPFGALLRRPNAPGSTLLMTMAAA